eukprot:10362776-Lingulodinium_polyedra.AAC.1
MSKSRTIVHNARAKNNFHVRGIKLAVELVERLGVARDRRAGRRTTSGDNEGTAGPSRLDATRRRTTAN